LSFINKKFIFPPNTIIFEVNQFIHIHNHFQWCILCKPSYPTPLRVFNTISITLFF
jgi:hypothetical protein